MPTRPFGLWTATIVLLTGCASVTPVEITTSRAAYIELTPGGAVLTGSQSLQLTAVVYDSAMVPLPGEPVAFTSSDESLITVSASGVVTRVGVGTAFVRARSGNARDSVDVTGLIARIIVGEATFGTSVSGSGAAFVTQMFSSSVTRIDPTAGTFSGAIPVGDLPTSVTFNQAGDRAFVGNQDGHSVSMVDVATNAVIGTLPITGSALSVAVAPGDSLLLVGTDVGKLYFVRLPALTLADSVPVAFYTNAIAFRDTLAFVNSVDQAAITVINLKTRASVGSFVVGNAPRGLLVSANGAELYVANEVGQLQYWSIATRAKVGSTTLTGGGGFEVARNPANGYLYVSTSYYGRRVHVINPATRAVVRVIVTGGVPRRIGFTSSGLGIVANEGGWVDIIQ
jgi:YVTN family beta-propeller protein